jgi:long-chain acyl-CoA synthetase
MTDDGARAPTYRRGMNLAANLSAAARRVPERPALKLDGAETSYRMLETASARLAGFLRRRGTRPGARVAVMLPNLPELVVVYYSVLRMGGVVVPVEPGLDSQAIAVSLLDAGVSLVFAWHRFAEIADAGAEAVGAQCVFVAPDEFPRFLSRVPPDRALHECERDAPAVLPDGTAVPLTHEALACEARAIVAVAGLAPADVTLGALPLLHRAGQAWAVNATIAAGACLVPMERYGLDAAVERIVRDGVTVFQGTRAMCEEVLGSVSGLRVCVAEERVLAATR